MSFNLSDVTRTYMCGASCCVTSYDIDFELFQRFSRALSAFGHRLNGIDDDDPRNRFYRRLRRLRYLLTVTPLPFNHPAFQLNVEYIALHCELAELGADADAAEEVLTIMQDLAASGANPLLTSLPVLPVTEVAFAIRPSHLIAGVMEVVNADARLNGINVLSVKQLRDIRCHTNIVLFGAAEWYQDRSPYIFAAPRAPSITVVRYVWLPDRWEPVSLFPATMPSTRLIVRASSPLPYAAHTRPDIVDEPIQDIPLAMEWGEAAVTRSAGIAMNDLVESVRVRLASGKAVLMEADLDASTLAIDPLTEQVKNFRVRDLEGKLLVLRIRGGTDYIVERADRILGGRCNELRARQRQWKNRLATHIEKDGLEQTADTLLNHISDGAKDTYINESNLLRWISPRSIYPWLRTDLDAIMSLIGLQDSAGLFWESMREIARAHISAGQEIRRELLDRVRKAGAKALWDEDHLEFSLLGQEHGTFGAFRVEEVLPGTRFVPASRLGRIYESGD